MMWLLKRYIPYVSNRIVRLLFVILRFVNIGEKVFVNGSRAHVYFRLYQFSITETASDPLLYFLRVCESNMNFVANAINDFDSNFVSLCSRWRESSTIWLWLWSYSPISLVFIHVILSVPLNWTVKHMQPALHCAFSHSYYSMFVARCSMLVACTRNIYQVLMLFPALF